MVESIEKTLDRLNNGDLKTKVNTRYFSHGIWLNGVFILDFEQIYGVWFYFGEIKYN